MNFWFGFLIGFFATQTGMIIALGIYVYKTNRNGGRGK